MNAPVYYDRDRIMPDRNNILRRRDFALGVPYRVSDIGRAVVYTKPWEFKWPWHRAYVCLWPIAAPTRLLLIFLLAAATLVLGITCVMANRAYCMWFGIKPATEDHYRYVYN